MMKIFFLLALAIASGVSAQDGATSGSEAAPEPYSYGYQTDTHAASEQRDPSGKVTGFYMLVDPADGRERRVDYEADASGFRAKIATNEVGTKSQSPADVELQASEPTPGQLVYQAPAQQVAQAQQVVRQQVVQQPVRTQYVQQPYGYGYGNVAYGTGYGNAYGVGYGAGNGYGSGYTTGYAYYPGYTGYSGYTGQNLAVGNYNNHLPSQYYRSISTTGTNVVPSTYTVGGQSVRYVSQPAVSTAGVRTVTYPGAVTYGVPGASSATSRTVGSSSSLQGSSNYIVLQKRATEEKKSN